MDAILDDIKVCGRSDLSKLLTMRHKYQAANKPEVKEEVKVVEEVDSDAAIEKELDQAMVRIEKEKKRVAKKERERKQKFDMRQKMSVIATSTGVDNDEELALPRRLWDEAREKGFEAAGENEADSFADESFGEAHPDDGSLMGDESSEDDRIKMINQLDAQMENTLKDQKDYQMTVDRRVQRNEIKKKMLID